MTTTRITGADGKQYDVTYTTTTTTAISKIAPVVVAPPPAPTPVVAPVSLFTTQAPAQLSTTEGTGASGDYELGMRFTSDAPGVIQAIRYYKSPGETGTHVGRIWSSTGQLLATVTFTNESPSGWQQQALTTPLAIAAGTTYVVSVNISAFYASTSGGFSSAISHGGLNAPVGAGIFNNAPGAFPATSFSNTNYFRDVVFIAGTAPPASAPVVNNGSFNLSVPSTIGQVVGTMTASGSPISWAITAGNVSGYFAIDATGKITVAAAGASGLAAGNYSLTCSATNTVGSGSGTAAVTATAVTTSEWPNASTTGVPAGTTLTPHVGDIYMTTAGQQIDALNITGRVYVQAPNCKITRCKIDCHGDYFCIDAGNVTGITITDCTLLNSGSASGNGSNVLCGGGTILRNNISGMCHCISSNGGNTIQDNYMHDMNGTVDGHYECIYIGGGAPGDTIRHNTMISFDTAVVFMKTDYGPVNNCIIDRNLMLQQSPIPVSGLHSTSYTIYLANTGGGMSGNQVTNNVMQKGFYGYSSVEANTPVWSNNTDYVTGLPISLQ
jgi:hypothetical protein